MADVVALISDRALRARIAEALRGQARAVFCAQLDEVRPAVEAAYARGDGVRAVILEPRDRGGVPTDALATELRVRAPAVPVLAYCAPVDAASGDLLAMARAGVSGLLLRGYDDVGAALRSALASAGDDCAARFILGELRPALPRLARTVVEHCVLHGREPLTVAGVADALGVNRKTLVVRFTAAQLPPPRTVIAWVRLCLVAHALERSGLSIERAAVDFGYPSAPALRNLCKRHTGLRLTEIRENGGLSCVLHLFNQVLRRAGEQAAAVA